MFGPWCEGVVLSVLYRMRYDMSMNIQVEAILPNNHYFKG